MTPAEENPFELQIERAFADYIAQCDAGQHPDRDTFLGQHPEIRERLAELLAAADWIEELAGPTLSSIASRPPEQSIEQSVSQGGGPDRGATTVSDGPRIAAEGVADLVSGAKGAPGSGRNEDGSGGDADHVATDETLPHFSLDRPESNQTLPAGRNPRPDFSLDSEFAKSPSQGSPDSSVERNTTQPILPCRFGDYMLERVLGRGGMGVVYYGRQLKLDRSVAIKMIRSGALATSDEVERFYTEARSAAKLDHPNIVTVYQCGETDGHHYFSMDYVSGTDLSRMTKEKSLDCRLSARYVRDAAMAIQYAHDCGVLHRDLKPANVLVDEQDVIHITDFGLAKLIGHETGLTATGAAIGTPSYMAPEQAAGRGDDHGPATDVYALGAILFTIAAGRPPFKAKTSVQTIMQVIHRPAPMLCSVNPSADEDIETICSKCLQKDPDERYQSAAELAADLDRYLAGVPIVARPMSIFQQGWHWLLGVPIFGALLDHRVIEPTDAHRWFQRGLISIAALMICAWLLILLPSSVWFKNRMPGKVRVAAGAVGGAYDEIGNAICRAIERDAKAKAEVIATDGSNDNLERLVSREADLALLQADAVGSSEIAVVAPLYYEVVHIIVRDGLPIEVLADLRDRRVNVGSEKTGSRQVAKLLLSHEGMSLGDLELVDSNWRQTQANLAGFEFDAAVVVSRLGDKGIGEILSAGYHLMSLRNAWQFALDEPAFHPLEVNREDYPDGRIAKSGVATVATTAFLAARPDTPDVLVKQVLSGLFTPEIVENLGILSAERAAHWQGLAWHPAARDFFQPYRGSLAADGEAAVSDLSSR